MVTGLWLGRGESSQLYKRLQKILKSTEQRTPLWYWDLGRLWVRIGHEWRLRTDKRIHGLTPTLAEEIGKELTTVRNMLDQARNTYQKFPFRQFVADMQQRGATIFQFRCVLPVRDLSQRKSLLTEALAKKWSTRELRRMAAKVPRFRGHGKAGAKVRPPRDINDALLRLIAENNRWIVWAEYCFGDSAYINQTQLQKARNEHIVQAVESLEDVKRFAKKSLAILGRATGTKPKQKAAAAAKDASPRQRSSKGRRQSTAKPR